MDLGTIERKFKSRGGFKRIGAPYADLQEFVDDVNLVFDNCFKYNGSTHAVSQLAIRVKDAFEESMKAAPGGEVRLSLCVYLGILMSPSTPGSEVHSSGGSLLSGFFAIPWCGTNVSING